MSEHTIAQNVTPLARPLAGPTMQALQASQCLPVVTLALLLARRVALRIGGSESILVEGWSEVAADLLKHLSAPEVQHARKVAQRAIRIAQGYETAAQDKAYQVLVEHVSGSHGVDRELSDEELVALNNGLLHAFAAYGAYLDHTAGALLSGVRS